MLSEIHNTHFLISSASTEDRAMYQVLDTSKDYKIVFESKEMTGCNKLFFVSFKHYKFLADVFDIANSHNTKKAALLSVNGRTIYHLLSTDTWTVDEQKWLPAHKDGK